MNISGRRIRARTMVREIDGAITVEYALCMAVAATIMLGVFVLFRDVSVQILDEFIRYVISFPDTM